MRRRSALLALLSALLLGMGAPGLRALHVGTDAGQHRAAHCEHACGDHDGGHGHGTGELPSEGHDEGCATCELLLAMAMEAGGPVAVPTFHAPARPADPTVPPRAGALPAPRVAAARPPPHALG